RQDLVRTQPTEAAEFHLEENSGRYRLRGRLYALERAAKHPAAGVVLHPGDPLQQAAVLERVVEAPDCIPAGLDRPLAGKIHLPYGIRRIAVVAVARVNHFCDFR